MRPRTPSGAPATAEETVRVWVEVNAAADLIFTAGDPARSVWVRERLLERGTDPVTAIAARIWLRRGKPKDYYHAVRHGWTHSREPGSRRINQATVVRDISGDACASPAPLVNLTTGEVSGDYQAPAEAERVRVERSTVPTSGPAPRPSVVGIDGKTYTRPVSAYFDGARFELTGIDQITGYATGRIVTAIRRT